MKTNWKKLIEEIITESPYCLESRVHKVSQFKNRELFIKRDDELGFGTSGTKLRKLAGLVYFLKKKHIQKVICKGSARSNHLISLIQVLREHNIKVFFYLKGSPSEFEPFGNFFFLKMLLKNDEYCFIDRNKWHHVDKEIQNDHKNDGTFILPEGANCLHAILGGSSLAYDIKKNEKDLDIVFDHIWICCGSGGSLWGLLLGLQLLEVSFRSVNGLIIAGSLPEFYMNSIQWIKTFKSDLNLGDLYKKLICFHPHKNASFGSNNKKLFAFIKGFIATHGILIDPIYMGKLLFELSEFPELLTAGSNHLVIHSGGGLSLSGYQKKFFPI